MPVICVRLRTKDRLQHVVEKFVTSSRLCAGVAGYGAALCINAYESQKEVHVLAVRFGVGGFAVGLVRSDTKPPFKSLGKAGKQTLYPLLFCCHVSTLASRLPLGS